MAFSETNSTSQYGLPGLRSIRDSVGIMAKDLAQIVGVTPQWISSLETGAADCTAGLQRRIAGALCCSPADLLDTPTTPRLAEITIDYRQRQIDEIKSKESEVA